MIMLFAILAFAAYVLWLFWIAVKKTPTDYEIWGRSIDDIDAEIAGDPETLARIRACERKYQELLAKNSATFAAEQEARMAEPKNNSTEV